MTSKSGPFDLKQLRAILGPDGSAAIRKITPDFYQELDEEFDGFAGHVLISQFEFEQEWGMWEMHPKGDELVFLLSGDVDFVLRIDGADEIVRVNEPGSYVLVPKGVWHTARPRAKTAMLFITPGEGTLNADEPTS